METHEKLIQDEEAIVTTRAVAFDHDGDDIQEKAPHGPRPKGVEMKKTLTQEEKDLAAAGYGHLEEQKARQAEKDSDLGNVDITEHNIPLLELDEKLRTSIDTKDPGNSNGLTSEEAQKRLAENGPNVLTPPKKKSALRKVSLIDLRHASFTD